ncbi:Uncharacterised protein [Vibrio cholerae]|nr:Uncharacterised protein [Vibrio cholerae]CSI51864.1 Uncharacterised protein [Vibrio cholerae]
MPSYAAVCSKAAIARSKRVANVRELWLASISRITRS